MGSDLDDVRSIATTLPGTVAGPDRMSFAVAERGFVWVYPERIDPKKLRVPNPAVVVIMVEDLAEKEACWLRIPRSSSPPTTTPVIDRCWSKLAAIERSPLTDAHARTAALAPKRPPRNPR